MNIWGPLKLLLPAYGVFWVFTICITMAVWYGVSKFNPKVAFTWQIPLLTSTFFTFLFCSYNFLTIYNSATLFTAQQSAQANQQAAQQQQQLDPALKPKADFLSAVEKMLQNPAGITAEAKKKLFSENAKALTAKEGKQAYYQAISSVYSCQRTFWEDALASYKTKQVVKSDTRTNCEKMSGAFFNREKLIPDAAVKSNESILEEIAGHKRVPASDGKEVEISEKMIQDAIDAQVQSQAALKKIFE